MMQLRKFLDLRENGRFQGQSAKKSKIWWLRFSVRFNKARILEAIAQLALPKVELNDKLSKGTLSSEKRQVARVRIQRRLCFRRKKGMEAATEYSYIWLLGQIAHCPC
jgi:hypothetical protein